MKAENGQRLINNSILVLSAIILSHSFYDTYLQVEKLNLTPEELKSCMPEDSLIGKLVSFIAPVSNNGSENGENFEATSFLEATQETLPEELTYLSLKNTEKYGLELQTLERENIQKLIPSIESDSEFLVLVFSPRENYAQRASILKTWGLHLGDQLKFVVGNYCWIPTKYRSDVKDPPH